MSEPKRIQRKRTKGWRMPEGAVNVTRGSDWGNPFKVGAHLNYIEDRDDTTIYSRDVGPVTREMAVLLFTELVSGQGWQEQIRLELSGRDLMCYCRLDQPCHADVLLELANGGAS